MFRTRRSADSTTVIQLKREVTVEDATATEVENSSSMGGVGVPSVIILGVVLCSCILGILLVTLLVRWNSRQSAISLWTRRK